MKKTTIVLAVLLMVTFTQLVDANMAHPNNRIVVPQSLLRKSMKTGSKIYSARYETHT